MLERFVKVNDIHRKKVIEYIKDNKKDLDKFELKDFSKYPGGISLTDCQGRRIIIYDDFLMNEIKEVYEEYNDTVEELTKYIFEELWTEYQNKAKYLNQIARLHADGKGNIKFYRYSIKENENLEKIHTSNNFNQAMELYDIVEYFETQNKKMNEEILKKYNTKDYAG